MGRYINWGDVGLRYSDAGKIPAETAENYFIQGAEAELDARLATKYTTPFAVSTQTDAPQLVRSLSMDIAYWMANRRAGWAEKFRKQIDEMLAAINSGTMILTTSAGAILTGAAVTIHTQPGLRSSFGMDDPRFWSPSSAWQEDLASGS